MNGLFIIEFLYVPLSQNVYEHNGSRPNLTSRTAFQLDYSQ
jgi:hypothetical protein